MSINLIWDMDGTLIDSYGSIVDCINKTLEAFNLVYDKKQIREFIQRESTGSFFEDVCINNEIEYEDIWNAYKNVFIDSKRIGLMPNVKNTLEELRKKNVRNFIYTHRGISTFEILENLNIREYFEEIVISDNGFKRKPNPDAINYLVDKYQLNRSDTYYVGDREIDIKCSNNAKINSIFYHSYKELDIDIQTNYQVEDLIEIIDLDILP